MIVSLIYVSFYKAFLISTVNVEKYKIAKFSLYNVILMYQSLKFAL